MYKDIQNNGVMKFSFNESTYNMTASNTIVWCHYRIAVKMFNDSLTIKYSNVRPTAE